MTISDTFIEELLKLCLRDLQVIEMVSKYLKYQYLPSESYKKIWKSILSSYEASGELTTPGTICQQYQDLEVNDTIKKINNTIVAEKGAVLRQFETFIKQAAFVSLYDSLGDMWNKGERVEALDLLQKESERISTNFLKQEATGGGVSLIYEGFNDRMLTAAARDPQLESKTKVPFSIDELDEHTHGGMGETDTALFTAQSGVGKTKLLRWINTNAARRGFKTIHFQLEGSEQECIEGFDATWTALSKSQLRYGDIDESKMAQIQKAVSNIKNNGGEIFVKAFEQFGTASMGNLYEELDRLFSIHGRIDLVTLDYLEKIQPSHPSNLKIPWKGKAADEQARREAIADQLKNIATIFKTRIVTATQASTVSPELLNNPNYVMTRYNISQFKAIVNPFSFHFTLNQTQDEYEAGMMRIFEDKLRNMKRTSSVVKIYQNYAKDRFYDGVKTRQILLGK